MLFCSVGERAIDKLKAQVAKGESKKPCDKPVAPPAPAAPKPFLDQRLPVVVDDYHPPVGGFNPTDIPSKEVDTAARKILREIQSYEAEQKSMGESPKAEGDGVELTTEEHKALKQLLTDADILVRAAAKQMKENGPVKGPTPQEVAASAVNKAVLSVKNLQEQKSKAEKAKQAVKEAAEKVKEAKKAAAEAKAKAAGKKAGDKKAKKDGKKAKKAAKKEKKSKDTKKPKTEKKAKAPKKAEAPKKSEAPKKAEPKKAEPKKEEAKKTEAPKKEEAKKEEKKAAAPAKKL